MIYNKPSFSPGSRFTRFCSQSSRSFPASLCYQDVSISDHKQHSFYRSERCKTYVVFLFHVHLPCRSAHIELFVLGHLANLAIIAFVADGSGGGKDERAGNDDGDEGEPEHEEGMLVHQVAISHADAVHVGRRPELLALECRHRGSLVRGQLPVGKVMDSEGRVGSSVCHSEVGRDPAKVEVKLSTAVDMVYRLTELDSRPGVFGSGRSVERMVQISTRIDQEEEFDLIDVQFDNIYRLQMT